MKKPIVLSLILAGMVLTGGAFTPTYAQAPTKDDTPTFYRLVPGTYVNGWPRFTVRYPKDWVEVRGRPENAFVAMAPAPARDLQLVVIINPFPLPLDKFADAVLPVVRTMGTDAAIVSNRPSRLRDGTPAQEVQFGLTVNGTPLHWLELVTKKDDMAVHALISSGAEIGEDLKAILYSIEFLPGFGEPVKVPPDVQAFLDEHCSASVAHDMEKYTSLYSDRYLNSGVTKGQMVGSLRTYIDRLTSFQIVITDFIPADNGAYLAGYVSGNMGKGQLVETSIIKENGQWRWYGNQRNVLPWQPK